MDGQPDIGSLRRRAAKVGLQILRSRARNLHINNQGGYQIVETARNLVFDGPDWDLDLQRVLWAVERAEAA